MLHGFNITDTRKFGETKIVTVPIWCENPGIITVSAPGCTFPDGDTVTIAGTREYRLDGRGGDYLAYPGIGQDREDVTWLFEVDFSRTPNTKTGLVNAFPIYPIATSVRQDIDRRTNWSIYFRRYLFGANDSLGILLVDSLDNLSADALYYNNNPIYAVPPGRIKFALTKATGGAFALHWGVRGPLGTGTWNSTGTMGGDEVLILHQAVQMSKISRICDNAELDAWFGVGSVVPATNREFAYLGNHEVVESAPVIYDSADPPHDLYAYTVTKWQPPGMSILNVDDPGNPVIPNNSIRIAVPYSVVSPINVAYSRPRQGVPSRAPSNERYETATSIVTLNDELVNLCSGPNQQIRTRLP